MMTIVVIKFVICSEVLVGLELSMEERRLFCAFFIIMVGIVKAWRSVRRFICLVSVWKRVMVV